MTGGFLSYFTRHRTAANLLLVIMVVLGLASATRIRSQFFPDVVSDGINVSVSWQGAGPEDVDGAVVAVLEPQLLAVEGVEDADSTAREGSASIQLEFEPGWDMGRAMEDVKSAVDATSNLPEGADEPTIRRNGWRDRVTDVVISGPVSAAQLARFGDEFVARLFREGITRTTIRGIASPEITIDVTEASLIRNQVTLREIASVIGAAADTNPAGDVAGGSARVRTGTEKRSAAQIEDITIRSNPDGSKLRVAEVASVTVEGIDRGITYFKGPNQAISIRVDRSEKGDAISMQAAVQSIATEMQEILPPGTQIELIRTRAEAITDRLKILLDNGIVGLGLVVVLLFLFLSARTALWVAAGIPVAMLAAIALMFLFGMTINMISLFALIICLGIVVDDAIVVGEHADFRHRRLGEPPVEAAENAARRMSMPVVSATVTTILAFFGLVSIGGRFGELIIAIPLTVIMVLIASLVECFLILPHHMSLALAAKKRTPWYDWPSRIFNIGFRWFRDNIFHRIMRAVVFFRYPVIAGIILILSISLSMLMRGDVTWRFFNAPEQPSISGNIAMLPGARRDDTMEMIRELQRAAEAVGAKYEAEHGTNPITFALAQLGGTTGRGLAGTDTKDEDQLGSIAIELIDADLRPYSSFAFVGDLQEEVRSHPLLETMSFRGFRSGPGGDALDVKFYGADATVLKSAAEALKFAVSRYSEVSAVEDNLAYDKNELILDLTPLGTNLGFTIDGIGTELRQRLNGIEAAEFPVGLRSAKVVVRLAEDELTADFLQTTRLTTPDGAYVPLSEIVTAEPSLGFSTVRRENGLRTVTVTGDISEDDPVAAEAVVTALKTEILPQITSDFGVEYQLGGLAEQEEEFFTDALVGFSLCLLGIYLTLAWIFSSWTRPLVVMAVIPFGLVGTIYGHYVWDVPLSIFTVVGLIGMSGIIINDSIVLVGTIDEYAQDRAIVPAVIDATADRLRPVLLTTLTTVLGLAPLLYETSAQAQFLKPTVITLAYGLGFGLLVVLLIVPSLVVAQADFGRLMTSLRRGTMRTGLPIWPRLLLAIAALASVTTVAASLGYLAITGQPQPLLINLASDLPFSSPFAVSFLAMLIGLLAIFMIVWILAALTTSQRRTAT